MSKKRFEVEMFEGSAFTNHFTVIVDSQTGVNYLLVKSGYGAGLTPLLDEKGNVIVTKKEG